jgi:hypothetical protein
MSISAPINDEELWLKWGYRKLDYQERVITREEKRWYKKHKNAFC